MKSEVMLDRLLTEISNLHRARAADLRQQDRRYQLAIDRCDELQRQHANTDKHLAESRKLNDELAGQIQDLVNALEGSEEEKHRAIRLLNQVFDFAFKKKGISASTKAIFRMLEGGVGNIPGLVLPAQVPADEDCPF